MSPTYDEAIAAAAEALLDVRDEIIADVVNGAA